MPINKQIVSSKVQDGFHDVQGFINSREALTATCSGSAAGLLTFNVAWAGWLQLGKNIRMTTMNRPIAYVVGLTGASLALLGAFESFHWVSASSAKSLGIGTSYPRRRNEHRRGTGDNTWFGWLQKSSHTSYHPLLPVAERMTVIASGLLAFRLLGGRSRYFAPSHLNKSGRYAQHHLAIRTNGASYATSAQKAKLQKIGKEYGCHHCGDKTSTRYIGDHIPPNKYARVLWVFRRTQYFYPQCVTCSSKQSIAVRMDRWEHVLPRNVSLYNLWLPISPFVWTMAEPLINTMLHTL